MLRPNDLPLVCLPLERSDEAAATLVELRKSKKSSKKS